ncbi:MAG: hypothetical protein IT436_17795 [Phycisphaerales bacterium]|nr:hypothetical protein [Phycisphaerales bacterium]
MNAPTNPSDSAPAFIPGFSGHRVVAPTLGWCALTATAHSLGASWLASPVMGMPAGVWLIGLGLGSPHALRAAAAAARRRARARELHAPPAWIPTSRRWPVSAPGRAVADAITSGLSRAADLAVRRRAPGLPTLAALHDRLPWPARPVRIALALDEARAAAIISAPGVIECELIRQPSAAAEDTEARELHRFDAIVQDGPAGLVVLTPEAPGHEASWYDWSDQRPLAYAGVFPMRVDCGRLSLSGLSMRSDRDAALARALIEAAAILSRSGHRLTLADRILGRRPVNELRCDGAPDARPVLARDPAEACLKDLMFRVQSFDLTTAPTTAQRAAARLVSAWLSTRPLGPDFDADMAARRRGIEAAAQVAGDEPEVMLRLAAVRFAAMDDDGGYDALWRADRILRDRQTLPGSDQFLFLQAELDMGPYGPMTLGRAAAGICLLCATTPVERIPYVRDDLIDDMRYSGWLVGRDQDRAMLLEVFRRIERIRRSERMGLPSAAAA